MNNEDRFESTAENYPGSETDYYSYDGKHEDGT